MAQPGHAPPPSAEAKPYSHDISCCLQITGAAAPEETPAATGAAAEGTDTQQADGTGDGNGVQQSPETETETAAPGGEFVWVLTTQREQRANAGLNCFLSPRYFRGMG